MSKRPDRPARNRFAGWRSAARPLTAKWRNARRLLAPPESDAHRPAPLEAFFGPLELRVLDSLWNGHAEATVRDLQGSFQGTAYTTLMTTLDRLYKKGVLERRKLGRAYAYSARFTRAGLEAYLAQDAFDALLDGNNSSALTPVLSSFVEAVSRKDSELLDELEALVQEARRRERDDDGHSGGGES